MYAIIMRRISVILMAALCWGAANSQDSREYCEWESFNATCRENEIILISSAKYGRMNLGRCVNKNYGHIGCGTDVTHDFDKECSGRRHCLISVISLHNKRSCPKDFKSYLEAGYKCLTVSAARKNTCVEQGVIRLTNSSGYISGGPAATSGGGGDGTAGTPGGDCPIIVEVELHQRIALSLVDFSLPPGSNSWYHRQTAGGTCNRIAVVSELNSSRENTTVCGGRKREAEVYTSSANNIIIRLDRNAKQHYLLRYEAFGCPPIEPPFNAWMKTNGEHAVVQCNETDEAWYLTCKGRDWVGHVGNCSEPVLYVPEEDWNVYKVFGNVSNFPFGILIVVALGVAIGVAIGVMMLVAVLAYMKRRRLRKVRSRSSYILKQVSGGNPEDEHDHHKPNHATHNTDQSPMLLKREPVHDTGGGGTLAHHSTINRGYSGTWHKQQRPLPVPKAPDSGISTDGEMDGVVLTTPEPPSPGSVFSTFKPSHLGALEAADFSPSNRNNYIVDGSAAREDGPYYFKVDPVCTLREHAQHMGCGHRPDVVTGCNCGAGGPHHTLGR